MRQAGHTSLDQSAADSDDGDAQICAAGTSRLPWHAGIACLLFGVYSLILLLHRRPPSLTDFSDWIYQGSLLAQHLRGIADPAHTLKHYPVPNSATTVGIGLLCLVFSWMWAAKLWLLLYLGLVLWTIHQFVKDHPGSELLWLIAPGTLFLNVNFWYGFLNFQIGLCLALLVVAGVLREEQREWKFGVMLLLAFFSHMIPFGFAATVLFLYAVRSRRPRLLLQFVPSAVATLAYLYGRFVLDRDADASVAMVSTVRSYSFEFWAYKINSLLKSGGLVNPASTTGSVALAQLGRPAFCLAVAADAMLCVCVLWIAVLQMRTALRQGGREVPVWWAVLIFTPVYVLLPGQALGVSDPGSRVLQVLLAVALMLSWRERLGLRIAAWPAVLLAALGVGLFAVDGYYPEPETAGGSLARPLVTLGHVPNHGQDMFFDALDHRVMNLPVFPTGIFGGPAKRP